MLLVSLRVFVAGRDSDQGEHVQGVPSFLDLIVDGRDLVFYLLALVLVHVVRKVALVHLRAIVDDLEHAQVYKHG